MSKKLNSSFLNKVFSSKSITGSTGKDSLFFGSCIAISPDSQKIVTFDPETHGFRLYDIDDLSSSKLIPTLECGVNDKHLCWSIAISNCVGYGKNERFIALSCFDSREFRNDIMYGDDESDLESGDKYLRPQTWVISTTDGNEIYTSSIGGVIRFLDSDDDSSLKNKTVIIIVNVSGIYKETMNNIKRKRFFSSSKIEQFELPQQLSIRLRLSRDHWQDSLEFLHTSIIKNYFMVHSFKNRQQIIEMYSLITGDLEILFKHHESMVAPNIIRGSPIFAISQNEKILAFCRGTTSITLYVMENGLEITTKQLEGQRGIYKIIAINFIDDDIEILKRQIFVVWDLFSTFENSIRQIDYSETRTLKMDVAHRLMNSHGKIFAVRDSGDIFEVFSLLDHKDVALIRYSSMKAITEIDLSTSDTVYLDSTESTQLIISGDTIQVWKYRNTKKRDKRDRVLKYIWARKKAMNVQELRIGEREFMLKVSVPSTKSSTPKSMTIHWPNSVNVLEGACQALYVLEEKKLIVEGRKNVNQIKYLVECTQRLVRKYITKYGIFRLTSIRYPIMKYLIKSYQESLIKHILNKKINRKNSNIYIPILHKWEGEGNNNRKSDLHYAIECIQERGDSTVILKYLMDYYTTNTKEYNNYGWMFTVSSAIPLLYDYHLKGLVQDLLKKPCFGITEAFTPPLHINRHDQRKGNNAAVIHSLEVKPCLASKPISAFIQKQSEKLCDKIKSIETSNKDRKVYMVPLPDFTAYPDPKDSEPKGLEDNSENYSKFFWFLFTLFRISMWQRRKVIDNTKKMSPFLRVIHEEKVHEIYQRPAIMAVLDFKWPAAHLTIFLFVYLYTGLYLILTEIGQIKREGWYRYMNNSNMFGLGSVLLPLANSIVSFLYSRQVLNLQLSVFNSISGLTALVMWLELLFLLRCFEGPGRFVYIIINILNTVWPFFAFMLSALLAFGHAMFIALKYAEIPTYKIKDTSNLDLYSNITIYQDSDKSYRLDNYYSRFVSSVKVVFFWTNGRWDQLDKWDNYAVNVISILGSIILVLIFQNMLIAFMNGSFDEANQNSRTAAHIYRAELVAEYEALEKPFDNKRSNPKNIYYIPDPIMINTWRTESKTGENLAELTDYSDDDYDDDNCDDDDNYNCDDDDDDEDNQASSSTAEYNDTIDKISFFDEEIFPLKVTFKPSKKSQRNCKSGDKSLENVSHSNNWENLENPQKGVLPFIASEVLIRKGCL
ncbi:hypothetical protein Glove_139g281 [Diversispora epigaea]|uniref:Ion transport domain-containing protein n=1 Tax=Diversispora epigaea TaxID=1348612 RepID=A0A397IVU4_9GLOM|nr:hypothetical protein Glove_139g281 [Diversispora epigaea]